MAPWATLMTLTLALAFVAGRPEEPTPLPMPMVTPTPGSGYCVCQKYWLCPIDDMVHINEPQQADIRATVPSCQWGREVCCRAPTPPPPPAPRQPDGVRANTTNWKLAELTVEGDDLLLRLSFNKTVATNRTTSCVPALPQRTNMEQASVRVGQKTFYPQIFFKANWHRAAHFCRFNGMDLATIESQEEHDKLTKLIQDYGFSKYPFWTAGTDQAEEGTFFWLTTGRPVVYSNWHSGEPNDGGLDLGTTEDCLEVTNFEDADKPFKWNDYHCHVPAHFVCQTWRDGHRD